MDRECFPKEMWLKGDELQTLLHHEAETTMMTLNGQSIGQAITIPEVFITDMLQKADIAFTASIGGMYSYSESILPAYQNRGYGQLLLHEIAVRIKQRGYSSISAHVRTRFGWNLRRRKTLNITTSRTIHNFWGDPLEVVQYQRANL